MSVLGDPDHIVLTLNELSDQAYRICRASRIPLLVDADHGYGNALNVRRTVEELETAGVSALSIEDTDLPARYGSAGKRELISMEEGVDKMRAAVSARQDPQLVIAARTSAALITDMRDVERRINAYQETGVDAIFLIGIKTREQLAIISRVARLPLILGGTGQDIMDTGLLSEQGVRICLQGHLPMLAALQATYETLKALRSGTAPKDISGLPESELVDGLTRSDAYDSWIRDFLG